MPSHVSSILVLHLNENFEEELLHVAQVRPHLPWCSPALEDPMIQLPTLNVVKHHYLASCPLVLTYGTASSNPSLASMALARIPQPDWYVSIQEQQHHHKAAKREMEKGTETHTSGFFFMKPGIGNIFLIRRPIIKLKQNMVLVEILQM